MTSNYLTKEQLANFPGYRRFETGKAALFVHVPKTAGTSLRHTLKFPIVAHTDFGKHYSLKEFQNLLAPDIFNDAFVFAFVRNPWDRLFSSYKFRVRVFAKNSEVRKKRFEEMEQLGSFEQWVRFIETRKNLLKVGTIFKPQVEWLKNRDGDINVDYLGKFENLKADYKHICTQLGISPPRLEQINISKRPRDYRHVYNDYLRDFVQEIYEEDIETFGYSY